MRKLLFLTVMILVVCLISSSVSLRSQQQRPDRDDEVATPVKDGELTERQKEHSKLYEADERKEKIRDVLMKRPGELVLHNIVCFSVSPKPLPPVVNELAEKADAVVSASFVSKTSQITAGGTYVFTDYELRLEEVFKDNRSRPLKPEATITVTRNCGKVLLNGQIVRFTSTAFKPFLPGRRYVLFLSYLPSTGAYSAVDANSSFDITDTRVESLNENNTRRFERELGAFITSVTQAVASDRKKGGVQ